MKESLHKNHRKRLRELVNKVGLNNLPEHQQLEYMLSFAMPRIDTNPLAHRLIKKFGNLSGVLNASPSQLELVDGIGERLSSYLCSFKFIFDAYKESTLQPKQKFTSPYETSTFFADKLRLKDKEEILLACLDDANKLLFLETIGKGTNISATLSVSEIFNILNKNNCSNFILAHNHPLTNALPSINDDLLTKNLYISSSLSGINFSDHIIIGKNDYYSYQENNIFSQFDSELSKLNSPTPIDRSDEYYGI